MSSPHSSQPHKPPPTLKTAPKIIPLFHWHILAAPEHRQLLQPSSHSRAKITNSTILGPKSPIPNFQAKITNSTFLKPKSQIPPFQG